MPALSRLRLFPLAGRFQGTRLSQIFLHYVDRNGPHADQKYDGRKTLMRPKELKELDEDHAQRV